MVAMAVIDALNAPNPSFSPSLPLSEDDLRRHALADFLRSRRERITPLDVGLPVGGRRRTPGLRREEVAQLAGVGVTWYTWLEQSRDIRVSEQVIDAIARALLLDRQERSHLFTLAGAPSAAASVESQAIPPTTLAMLDQLCPFPAAVVNGRYDILAFNRAYAGLMGDLGALPVPERNTLWLLFSSVAMRNLIVDWEAGARRCVATYRTLFAEHMAEPAWKCLPKRLAEESAEFSAIWARHDVGVTEISTKRFRHPELGLLSFEASPLWFRPHGENRLIVYTPSDAATAERVGQLATVTPHALDVIAR